MAGYVTVNRLSLVELHSEERKHRAHLKKIADMQRRGGGLDNSPPAHFPRVHTYTSQLKERRRAIVKENDVKSKKILEIMQSKIVHPPPPFHSPPSNRRPQPSNLSPNNSDFLQRIAKTKGNYNAREWKREFEEHKEHLKIRKDSKLFTPRDIAISRQRSRSISISNSRRPTPTSSTNNMGYHRSPKNNY